MLIQLKEQIEQGGSESSDDLGTFAEFHSLCLESELDDNRMMKHYKLCCSKNDILHDKILNLNSKMVVSIISETVKIVDAVKACDFFTPTEKLEQWKISLKSFKLLGMKVEFLVDRVSHLFKLRVVEGYFDQFSRTHDEITQWRNRHRRFLKMRLVNITRENQALEQLSAMWYVL